MKKISILLVIPLLALALALGCAPATSTTATTSATSATTSPTSATTSATATTATTATTSATSVTSAAGQTAGQAAQAGQAVYAASCASCHGATGQGGIGPRLIGSGQGLSKYNTAQGLLNYTQANMPFNAPGSLPHAQYVQVTAYLLVQNNYLAASAPYDESNLGNISLK